MRLVQGLGTPSAALLILTGGDDDGGSNIATWSREESRATQTHQIPTPRGSVTPPILEPLKPLRTPATYAAPRQDWSSYVCVCVCVLHSTSQGWGRDSPASNWPTRIPPTHTGVSVPLRESSASDTREALHDRDPGSQHSIA
jgi:hypothetical protein